MRDDDLSIPILVAQFERILKKRQSQERPTQAVPTSIILATLTV